MAEFLARRTCEEDRNILHAFVVEVAPPIVLGGQGQLHFHEAGRRLGFVGYCCIADVACDVAAASDRYTEKTLEGLLPVTATQNKI